MATVTHDSTRTPVPTPSRTLPGLTLALVSAGSFGLSGPLARGLLETGWTAGALVIVRVGLAALLVAPFAARALRGRWHLLRRNAGLIAGYGLLAVAGAQFCYFSAVGHMQVGPALLIEFTAPAAVVVWLWLRHGQRPSWVTLLGAVIAAGGLVLLLDLLSGTDLSVPGVLWASGAMLGAATYFIISADEANGLPPLVLAAGGLTAGTLGLVLLALVGLLPIGVATAPGVYDGHEVPAWLVLVVLGAVTAVVPYVTGVAAGRRLGSRLASFVGLSEALAGVLWAWVLLAELPGPVQLVGGLLVLVGVATVKLGE